VLRYFACRGRGQALVYMLEDSGQPYTLDQAELAVGDSAKAARWQAAKADKQASGSPSPPPTNHHHSRLEV
jgi:hypothetical protein